MPLENGASNQKRFVKKGKNFDNLHPWLKEVFEPSLLISLFLVLTGGAVSWYAGKFSPFLFLVVLLAALLIQISVNTFNDYFDYLSGIDEATEKTPFSGGSSLLVRGMVKPEGVFILGLTSLLAASLIGIYLAIVSTVLLIPLIAEAGVVTYIYTPFLARNYLGEFFTGLNLGPLSLLGTYMALTGKPSILPILFGIPPGIMIANVLLMNEIPDFDADKRGGRRNLVTLLGKKRASELSLYLGVSAYLVLFVLIVLRSIPFLASFAFLSLPIFIKSALGAKKYNSSAGTISPYLGINIISSLLTMLLLTVSLFITKIAWY